MIILGDKDIPYNKIENIVTIEDIKSTKPNSTLLFHFDKKIMKYCIQNQLNYMVKVSNIVQVVYSNSLKASYILYDDISNIATIQKLAETYLFDSKIIVAIKDENEIERLALLGIDGVVFKNSI